MDKPKICVVIPWLEQPSRVQPYKKLVNWYYNNFPDYTIIISCASKEVWLPSHTRNLGVRLAEDAGADIVIMNDADTFPNISSLESAIDAALSDDYIHNPYKTYRQYSEEDTQKIITGSGLDGMSYLQHESNAGVWVFKPSSWWKLGGMDEKFEKWGYEDSAFEHVHKVVHGIPFVKHYGFVFAMSHETQDDMQNPSESLIKNKELFEEYLTITNAKEILKLVKRAE